MAEKTENNPRGAGRPKIADKLRKVNITVKIPAQVKAVLAEGSVNASALVTELLEDYLDKRSRCGLQ